MFSTRITDRKDKVTAILMCISRQTKFGQLPPKMKLTLGHKRQFLAG